VAVPASRAGLRRVARLAGKGDTGRRWGVQFTVGDITRCSGQGHYQVPVTVGAVTRTIHTTLEELQQAAPSTIDEARDAIIGRIRSALLEANAATFAQVQAALEGNTFEV
jgi:hypothetical protein